MTSPKRCPICSTPVTPPVRDHSPGAPPPPKSYFPFCSDHCRMVDLGRWLTGAYAIPGEPLTDEPERDASPPPEPEAEPD